MTVENIIQADPTLLYFIKTADIDWFNDWQVSVRFTALRIAIFNWIDKQ